MPSRHRMRVIAAIARRHRACTVRFVDLLRTSSAGEFTGRPGSLGYPVSSTIPCAVALPGIDPLCTFYHRAPRHRASTAIDAGMTALLTSPGVAGGRFRTHAYYRTPTAPVLALIARSGAHRRSCVIAPPSRFIFDYPVRRQVVVGNEAWGSQNQGRGRRTEPREPLSANTATHGDAAGTG
jgi:hypothetical protein